MKGVKEKLLPIIPPNSELVVDNVPYYNVQSDKCSTQISKKNVSTEWRQRNGVQYNENTLKI
jgi:hypothetical protein